MTQAPKPSESAPILSYAQTEEGIREIATRQRALILCILLYLVAVAAQFFVPPQLQLVFDFGVLGIIVVSTVFVFLLCTKLYGVGIGILLGFLTLVPCAGLVTLLIVNAKATAILRKAGLKVGLLGASVPR